VSEHAQQVTRMLPGGLAVLGIYLFCPEAAYSSASSQLASVLDSVAHILEEAAQAGQQQSGGADSGNSKTNSSSTGAVVAEVLLLHADASSRKQLLRFAPANNPSNLKPCELKYGPVLSTLVLLQSSYTVSVQVPVMSSRQELQSALQAAADGEARWVMSSMFGTFDSAIPSDAVLLSDVVPADAGVQSAVFVPLYAPWPSSSSSAVAGGGSSSSSNPTASSSEKAVSLESRGVAMLHGQVAAFAYAHKREPAVRGVSALKEDVARSLAARVNVLMDEVLAATDAAAAEEQEQDATRSSGGASQGGSAAPPAHPLLYTVGGAKTAVRVGLPQRVCLPWVGGLRVCDYMSEGEAREACADRALELLGVKVEASQVGGQGQA
jgi:hypothetical protein